MFKIYHSKAGTRYLYDSVSNNIFEVDDHSYSMIGQDEGPTSLLHCLGNDFWLSVFGDLSAPTLTPYETNHKPRNRFAPETLVLELTQQCNLRCKYCIYSGCYENERIHTQISMSEQTVDDACKKYFLRSNSCESVPSYISFYGGEPLLGFNLIKRVCNTMDKYGFCPNYSITTNGLLLVEEEIIAYLIRHNFHLNISFDGLNHDLYRLTADGQPTSDVVMRALRKIKTLDEQYYQNKVSLSATLAPPYSLKDNAIFFSENPLLRDLRLNLNLVNEGAYGVFDAFDMEAEQITYQNDLTHLLDEYIDCEKPTFFLSALFATSVSRIDHREMTLQTNAFPPGQCDLGERRLFVTAEGNEYVCERVGSYGFLGNVSSNENKPEFHKQLIDDFSKATKGRCESCHIARICDMCISSLRQGERMGYTEFLNRECDLRRKWFDMIMYAFLSRKETGREL